MKKNFVSGLLLVLSVFLMEIPKGQAQNAEQWIDYYLQWGLYYARQGDEISANNYFANAKGVAYDSLRYFSLLQISWCHAEMQYNNEETWRCYDLATQIAYNWAAKGYRQFAIQALQNCITYYETNIRPRVTNPNTLQYLTRLNEQAKSNLYELQNAPNTSTAPAQVGIDAVSAHNAISAGKSAVRGFGDSDVIDRLVPFNFNYGGGSTIVSAKVIIDLKPIDADLQTEGFLIVGASGQIHRFNRPIPYGQKGQRMQIEIDLTKHPQWADILGALRSGYVQCCFEDDSAVFGAKLILNLQV